MVDFLFGGVYIFFRIFVSWVSFPLFFFASFVSSGHSVPNNEALVIVSLFLGFFVVVLVTVGLVCSIAFLVFVYGLLYFCDVPTSSYSLPFSPFLTAMGTFH
jgi:hypothetical protein